eukprot:288216-Ditylum_brightwellii.AAC.1
MRTAPTSSRQQSNPDVKQVVIKFTRPTPRQLKRGQFYMYKLCTTPVYVISPTYELPIPFFEEETPGEWIKFRHRLQAVLKGQN